MGTRELNAAFELILAAMEVRFAPLIISLVRLRVRRFKRESVEFSVRILISFNFRILLGL